MFFVLSLTAERYLRHAGRLHPNSRRREKVCACFAIFFAIVGQIGIILVAVFDTVDHPRIHVAMLCMFLVGIGISIVFTTVEFFALDRAYKEINRLRISYVVKAFWFVVALILAITMASFWGRGLRTVAAVLEWALAFFYGFYLFILSYDLYPAAKTPKGQLLEQEIGLSLSRAASWLPGLRTKSISSEEMEQRAANETDTTATNGHYLSTFNNNNNNNNMNDTNYYQHRHDNSLTTTPGVIGHSHTTSNVDDPSYDLEAFPSQPESPSTIRPMLPAAAKLAPHPPTPQDIGDLVYDNRRQQRLENNMTRY